MRRAGALLGLFGVLALAAGCTGRPAGVDGDLVDDWPAMADPVTPVPVAGVCYDEPLQETWYGGFDPVDCDESHHSETVYVGSFTGATADRTTAPRSDQAARADAYGTCQQALSDYLGGDWHTAAVTLVLVLPSDAAWTGGARWYRCDVAQFQDLAFRKQVVHGSVKDGLRGKRPLAITCFVGKDAPDDTVVIKKGVDCAKPHNGEFAGLYTPPKGAYPKGDRADQLGQDGCEAVVADYLGFSGKHDTSQYIGWMWTSVTEDQWRLGDRTIQCLAYTWDGEMIKGSIKGIRGRDPS